ncbi:hypothetical protein QC762_0075380 [Podospora pseudocomata]|uniref:Glycine-rich domain-containing protein-like n=1 Tax=Podospora pseudocomata TaxID=2093779 RepID=A0ABR0GA64_9PEZI|nr:hypothetical protein QC762_0075380 [Podospora pseudocomata]
MVWHSFMLNPHAYAEFCTITRPGGAGDGGIPWLPVDLSPDLLESLKAQVKTHPDVLELLSAEIDHTETVLSKQALRFSPSVLDLAAAVHRQAAFARKMTRFGWIRSPNVDSMLGRAISRYRNFFSLFAVANHATVPTIDIDLVWHTHQLSPAQYTLYSEKAAQGRFINHNDNIEQADILSAFQSTRALYQRVFGEEYVVCNSWFCEAARSKPTDSGAISESRLTALQSLIKESSLRSPVQLDLAECDCHKVGIHGARGGADRAVASCGDCNSSCNAS